jgi:hypothetical protein
MGLQANDVPFKIVDTARGRWGVFVQSVVRTRDKDKLFLTMILEQEIDDEHFRMRKLEMFVFESELITSQGQARILSHIREWIEKTEGDGQLDLVSDAK